MADPKRLSMNISSELDQLIETLARGGDMSRSDVVRRALSVMKAYQEQKAAGRGNLGFTADPAKLDAQILNVL